MTAAFTIRETCQLCGGALLEIHRLADSPLANELVGAPCEQDMYPMILSRCAACDHVQTPVEVDPSRMFREDYAYVAGTSPVFREHIAKLARQLSTTLFPDDLVVEFGSNDGTLLKQFAPPIRTLGVDPARGLADEATRRGMLTYPGFMTVDTARAIVRSVGRASLVLGLNVFAHSHRLGDIADAARETLTDDGRFVFEVAYLPDMLRDCTFDLQYLEHASYWGLKPMVPFFAAHGLTLYDAERIDTQGGSIRCYVSKRDRAQTDQLRGILGRERELVTPEALDRFKARIATTKTELTELLAAIKAKGHRIAAFGCPAKATTLCHHFGIGRETIDYIVEENPHKIGKFSPGKHVAIVGVDHFRANPPTYCLILAWNFATNIRNRFDWFTDGGGQWILPMPKVEVVG